MAAVRLALSQFGAEMGDVGANLESMLAAVAEAAAGGADVVCFPELSLSGYLLRIEDYSEPLLDAVRSAERELAAASRRSGVTLVYGTPARGGDGCLRNLVVLQDGHGDRLVYGKTHMVAKERRVFTPGSAFVVDERGIGLACCYDLAFPEAMRVLGLRGARLLIVPMAWEVERGFVMRRLMAARAIENVAYVAGVNQCGTVGEFRFCGGSCMVNPLGDVCVSAGDASGLVIADVDVDWVTRLRGGDDDRLYPLWADRRPDLYGLIATAPCSESAHQVLSQT
jgi:predicted amidohydrolase